jgi:HipA-like C-terminal domain
LTHAKVVSLRILLEIRINPITERWRDLLLAEHHALETLASAGIDAARSWIVDQDGQRFLEVERFDRIGSSGRCGLFSLSALEAEFVGNAQAPWPVLVERLASQRVVAPQAVSVTQALFAFGRLIGNSDMHAGNLSFVSDRGRPYALAPAYDMLPMAFAPRSGGGLSSQLPPLELHPSVAHEVWPPMLALARDYLGRLRAEGRFSGEFAPCLQALAGHLDEAQRRIERLG